MSKGFKECDNAMSRIAGMHADTNDTSRGDEKGRDRHLDECDDCRATLRLLEAAQGRDGDHGALSALDDLETRRLVDTMLAARHEMTHQSRPTRMPGRRWGLAACAVTAVALGLSYVVASRYLGANGADTIARRVEKWPVSVAAEIAGSRFDLVEGRVRAGTATAGQGSRVTSRVPIRVDEGKAILSLPKGIVVSLSDHTVVAVEQHESEAIAVALDRGSAFFALDPKRPRRRFEVITDTGVVSALGTIFTVVVSNGSTRIHLHRGTVVIQPFGAASRTLQAGGSATMDGAEQAGVSADAETDARTRGSEILALGLADHLRPWLAERTVADRSSNPISADTDRPEKREPGAAASPGSGEEPPLTLKALMQRARSAKLAHDWKRAVAAYERVLTQFPRSKEAQTSKVLLGELSLDRLARPKRALAYFKKYLSANPNGPLAQEALFGRANCHRALGQTAAERETLARLLEKYPKGLYDGAARKRIQELSK